MWRTFGKMNLFKQLVIIVLLFYVWYCFLAIFELVTKYKNWEEIKKGNLAVAMATGGKIFGIANIFRHSIEQHDTLLTTIGWGFFGFLLIINRLFYL